MAWKLQNLICIVSDFKMDNQIALMEPISLRNAVEQDKGESRNDVSDKDQAICS
jgi:hypothetical protein